jgi:hypothetical protein
MALDPDRYDPALKRGATLDASNLGADSVAASEIAAGAVGTSELATGAVNTADIAAGAVTETKQASSVQKILTGSFDMADASASYIFSVQNPESVTASIENVIIKVTTAAGAAGTTDVDVGQFATSSDDDIIDGGNLNSAGYLDRIGAAGTNGGNIVEWAPDYYLNADLKSGTSGNVAGTYRIIYHT